MHAIEGSLGDMCGSGWGGEGEARGLGRWCPRGKRVGSCGIKVSGQELLFHYVGSCGTKVCGKEL